ncbi:MAG: sugar transferase, partial [Carnobacterium sp.]
MNACKSIIIKADFCIFSLFIFYLLLEFLPLYNKEQFKRHKVRPGITGWAQINGRNTLKYSEKFRFDVWY